MADFCTSCGAPLSEGTAFCESCGARAEAADGPPQAPAAAPAKSGSLFLKVVALVLAVLALVTIAGIGSCVYIGYRAKQKAEQLARKAAEVKETATALVPQHTAKMESCPALAPSDSQAFRAAAASASVPLKPGLRLVSVWTNPGKEAHDLESMATVDAVEDNTVKVTMANNVPEQNKWSRRGVRTLCIADLLNGRQYVTVWGGESEELLAVPETIVGATFFSVSRAMFQELKAGRPAELEYFVARQSPWSFTEYGISGDFKVQLARVEPQDVPYSVILNDERTDLPTIHVKGRSGETDIEAYILDDPANPLTLNFLAQGATSYITYVKISYPVEKKIERELASGACAAVYGIYFDFDSARLRPESEPALKEIAGALEHNPAWRLKIEGHTDNIGGDEYNMTLSSRRAEAVKEALTSQFSISAPRLTTAGFGATRPKAANDTVEGRALNRRVELCRQ